MDTNRWLLVNRQQSPEFIITIRGSYRISDISRLVNGYSVSEVQQIRELIKEHANGNDKLTEAYRKIFKATVDGSSKDFIYALTRFRETASIFEKNMLTIVGKQGTEWLWPKGRLHTTSEIPYRCAIREFSEETGIPLRLGTTGGLRIVTPDGGFPPYCVSPVPIVESFRGTNGRIYETRCWLIVFPKEIAVPPVLNESRPTEIGARKWVTEEEARTLLQPNKLKVLSDASQLLASRLKNSRNDTVKTPSENPSERPSPEPNPVPINIETKANPKTDLGAKKKPVDDGTWKTVTRKRR